MFMLNIFLAIVGILITIGATFFWYRISKLLRNQIGTEYFSGITVNKKIHKHYLLMWLYQHKSKLDIAIAGIVTIIEFFALIPF